MNVVRLRWWRWLQLSMLVSLLVATFGLIPAPATSQDTQPPQPVSDLQRLVTATLAGEGGAQLSEDNYGIPEAPEVIEYPPYHTHDTVDLTPTEWTQAQIDAAAQVNISAPIDTTASANSNIFDSQFYRDNPEARERDIAAIMNWSIVRESTRQQGIEFALREYLGQSPLPIGWESSFQNEFFSGPGFAGLSTVPSLAELVVLDALSATNYTPQFLASLNALLSSPTASVFNVPIYAVNPDRCSRENTTPGTVTFVNTASFPAAVIWVDYQCQEVLYRILPPGTVYTQPTYVTHVWRVRNALTGTTVLNGDHTIPNELPQTVVIFDLAVQQRQTKLQAVRDNTLDVQAAVDAGHLQAAPGGNLEALKARYDALRRRQLAHYYTDPMLSNLRVELNRNFLGYIYLDPYYLYWSYELDTALNQIRTTRPSYPTVVTLSQEIASWTTPPTDDATLRSRYMQRLLLQALHSQLDNEIEDFLATNPQLADRLRTIRAWLAQRRDQAWSLPSATLWYADWKQRWQQVYFTSDSADTEIQELNQILSDYPTVDEYFQLKDEVDSLLPAFAELPKVRKYIDLHNAVLDDQSVDNMVAQHYNQYTTQVTAILNTTPIPGELEHYYTRLNALLNAHPTYIQLKTSEYIAVTNFQVHQQRVHAAMAQCYARDSANCDGYSDLAVIKLLYSDDAQQSLRGMGRFYEKYNRFWYDFYNSKEYLTLENATKERLQAPLTAVQPRLQSIRDEFTDNVESIPQVQNLRSSGNRLYAEICDNRSALASFPIADPASALCQRLDRMTELSASLNSTVRLQAGDNFTYLPVIIR